MRTFILSVKRAVVFLVRPGMRGSEEVQQQEDDVEGLVLGEADPFLPGLGSIADEMGDQNATQKGNIYKKQWMSRW